MKCFTAAKREIICCRILWNISPCSMWNEICPRSRSEHFTFAKQIFHREAISLARKGKFRWRTCFIAGAPIGASFSNMSRFWHFVSIFLALMLSCQLDALCGGNANHIHALREVVDPRLPSKKQNGHRKDVHFVFWWKRVGSNHWPPACQAGTLTNWATLPCWIYYTILH